MTDLPPPSLSPVPDRLPNAYTAKQIAKKYRMDPSTVCVAIQRGELKAGRCGRRYMILPSAVVEWMSRVKP